MIFFLLRSILVLKMKMLNNFFFNLSTKCLKYTLRSKYTKVKIWEGQNTTVTVPCNGTSGLTLPKVAWEFKTQSHKVRIQLTANEGETCIKTSSASKSEITMAYHVILQLGLQVSQGCGEVQEIDYFVTWPRP